MPFALLIIGAVLLVAGTRGTQDDLFNLVKADFTTQPGQPSFPHWMLAILVIGALGYVPALSKLSRAFLVLVIIVLFLSNGGFFQKFNQQLFGS